MSRRAKPARYRLSAHPAVADDIGDLTGLSSAKFDVPESPTRRFRLVYG